MEHKEIEQHFDSIALEYDRWKKKNAYYYTILKNLYSSLIPPGKNVIEIGCATGDILASVKPHHGVGVDLSSDMLRIASRKYPALTFVQEQGESIKLDEQFDYIIMCDLVEHLQDIWETLGRAKQLCHKNTKLVISYINPFWEPLLLLSEKLGMKMPEGPHNRLYMKDIISLLDWTGFKIVEIGQRLLIPKKIPLLSNILNSVAAKWSIFRSISFVQYIVAQPVVSIPIKELSCSVIIPCFNEAGNIAECVRRIPAMGSKTEIVVVDDGSTDNTSTIVKDMQLTMPNLKLISHFPNRGKGRAVKRGFDAASNDVLMILDADMTVMPEELPRFIKPLVEGKADAVNGTRMVYPLEKQSMRQLHLLGNKAFSLIFTWLMGQRVTDTLCGTKVIPKKDYVKMEMGKCPWGDFDILIGISKLGLKMVEVPVHYKARIAGKSKMKAFRHGFKLLGMCFYGFRKLKLKF